MIDLPIHTQPDDETCGPTCLHALYQYYGVNLSLNKIIQEVERSYSGGTLAPLLGKHALKQDFEATLYVNNLDVFDPTWFHNGEGDPKTIITKLEAQLQHKTNPDIVQSSLAYQSYLQMGGKIRFHTLHIQLLKNYFKKKIPIQCQCWDYRLLQ
jgi:ABC-type bacteriocin/lantibiotic exporter with double-glycine peptidase domain